LYVLALESEPIAKKPRPLPNTPDSIPKGHVVRLDTDGTRSSDVLLEVQSPVRSALRSPRQVLTIQHTTGSGSSRIVRCVCYWPLWQDSSSP
jgi:hypothetical protein